MPNFKLSDNIKDTIITRARNLAQRRIEHMGAGFPMDAHAIEAAINEPDDLATLQRLARARGVTGLPRDQSPVVLLRRDDYPGLARGAVIEVSLPEPIFVTSQYSNYWYNDTHFEPSTTRGGFTFAYAEPDPAVATWVNRMVRERRLQEIATQTVKEVIERVKSTGELLATWPMLATLAHGDEFWRNRLRNPPRRIESYNRMIRSNSTLPRLMQASEVFLAAADMMEPFQHPRDEPRVTLCAWERLASDPKLEWR